MKINLQPLKTYQPQPELTHKELVYKSRLARKGNILDLGVNEDLWYQAIISVNGLGLNMESVLNYLVSQIPLRPKHIKFDPNTDNIPTTNINKKEMLKEFQLYGKKINGSILEGFMYLEIGINVAKCADVLNAILSQLILNKKVDLIIDQSPQSREKWDISRWNTTLPDTPSLAPIKEIKNIEEIK